MMSPHEGMIASGRGLVADGIWVTGDVGWFIKHVCAVCIVVGACFAGEFSCGGTLVNEHGSKMGRMHR